MPSFSRSQPEGCPVWSEGVDLAGHGGAWNGKALHYLQTVYQQNDALFLNICGDRTFAALHNEPTFRALERKSGLLQLT